jgi:carbon-monoxide dehydrogenase medium subunit
MENFTLESPTTKSEVLALLANADEETRLIAGGTGLINLVKQRLAYPERLISLHKTEDMANISSSSDALEIGALTRLIDLQNNEDIASKVPVLTEALAEVASPRIRSMATVGGAVSHADPNQDLPTALIALDTIVLVESADASREIPIADFYADYYETALEPNEMVTGIRIPVPNKASRFAYKKFTPGSREDYACVGVCIRLDIDDHGNVKDSRIVLGSVAPTIRRVDDAEQLILNQEMTEALAAQAGGLASNATDPVDDTRGSANYKTRMAGVWVKRCLLRAAD